MPLPGESEPGLAPARRHHVHAIDIVGAEHVDIAEAALHGMAVESRGGTRGHEGLVDSLHAEVYKPGRVEAVLSDLIGRVFAAGRDIFVDRAHQAPGVVEQEDARR
jgi:hypothetical protein